MSLEESYRELDLYLQQVNDEIMRAFADWKLPYGLEAHATDAIAPNHDLVSSESSWDADDSFIQSLNNVTDIKHLINFRLQQQLCSKSCNSEDATSSISEGSEPSTEQMPLEYANYSQWPYCISSNDSEVAPKISSSTIEDSLVVNGNSLAPKSMENLNRLSWLYWQQWQSGNIDYAPVVPMLKKVTVKVNKQTGSQLDRHLAEIEATEACKWLRAAGFPQYAQMYEEMQFPIDITAAQHDHPLLEPAVLQSLFRRLHTLNQCASVCQQPCSHTDDSEDEQCALSDNWTYQSDIRRWSRTCATDQLGTKEIEDNKEKSENASITTNNNSNNNSKSIGNNNTGNITISGKHSSTEKLRSRSPVPSNRLLRRAASTKFRHHREGVVLSDEHTISTVSDILLKRLASIKYADDPSNLTSEEVDTKDESAGVDEADGERPAWNNQRIEAVIEEESKDQARRPIVGLCCTQLQILRKLALLKLTAHVEKYCPSHRAGWNWELPKFIKKIRNPSHKENQLLNLPIAAVLQRIGQPLPKGIQEALEWLSLNGYDQVGLFRKPGVRSRIQALKVLVESQGENINFNDQQPYDVADMIKQYFRELPEAVLTNKLSETFILIFQYVPPYLRREAVLCTLLLMPDEHREVLQALLHFLLKIAKYSDVNQMNDSNLAICFAPALFQYGAPSSFYRPGLASSNPRELIEIKSAQECLLFMLRNNADIFNIPKEFLNQCKLSEMNDTVVQLAELGASDGGWRKYMQECHSALLKEVKEKNRGWIVVSTPHSKVELSYKKVSDGHPLRLWKVCVDVEAPPSEVLHRILRERHIWDDDLHSAKIVAQMNKTAEVFHYVRRNIAPLPYVDYCVIRMWNTDLPRGTCIIVETSVEHPDIPNIPNTIRGIVLASRYLIEPGGSGRSRLLHLSRVDIRGRMPEWYHKNYGHLCAIHAARLQGSFHQIAVGPESKV